MQRVFTGVLAKERFIVPDTAGRTLQWNYTGAGGGGGCKKKKKKGNFKRLHCV